MLSTCSRQERLPTIAGINPGKESSVAASLLQYNLEMDDTMQLVDGEQYALTVTPAIAVVLFAMVGISTSWMSGSNPEENLAVLYACRQWIVECMESFPLTDNQTFDRLEKSLSRIRLVALRAKVQEGSNKSNIGKWHNYCDEWCHGIFC